MRRIWAMVLVACAHQEPPGAVDSQAFAGQADVERPPAEPTAPRVQQGAQSGLATWYGPGFAGRKTSSGERFDPRAMTAAHRKLPFGTWVEVRRLDTGRSVRVRINDRGPWGDTRKIIDLSRRAAEQLGMVKEGFVRVEVRVIPAPD